MSNLRADASVLRAYNERAREELRYVAELSHDTRITVLATREIIASSMQLMWATEETMYQPFVRARSVFVAWWR
jgi:hypothetical protein